MTAIATEPRKVATTRWTLDPDESSVEFTVKTFWGLTTVHGHFDVLAGSYETGPDGATIDVTIDANSLDTGNRTRDKHLRSTDFFHVAAHPHGRFTSSRVRPTTDGGLHVEGDLEVAGKHAPLAFDASLQQIPDGLRVEATATIDQSQFGMSSGQLGMIRRPTTLHIKARLSGLDGDAG